MLEVELDSHESKNEQCCCKHPFVRNQLLGILFDGERTHWLHVLLQIGASSEDRTHDLSLTKGVHYHCATEANSVGTSETALT